MANVQSMTANPYSYVPAYEQIAAQIRERIESGDLEPYDRLPTEKEIVDLYGVARGTARRVMQALREEGLAFTVPARGTFVAPQD